MALLLAAYSSAPADQLEPYETDIPESIGARIVRSGSPRPPGATQALPPAEALSGPPPELQRSHTDWNEAFQSATLSPCSLCECCLISRRPAAARRRDAGHAGRTALSIVPDVSPASRLEDRLRGSTAGNCSHSEAHQCWRACRLIIVAELPVPSR
jgi:hypothetical protein